MSPRALSRLLALMVALLVLLLMVSMFLPGVERWRPAMIGLGAAIGLTSIALMVKIARAHSADQRSHEAQAEGTFEREVMLELGVSSVPAAPTVPRDPPAASSQTPESSTSSPPGPETQPPRAADAPAAPRIESLLTQLRLAKLDPKIEGEVRAGPQTGGVIIRLGRDEVALAVNRIPSKEDWRGLFPRYDRLFMPLDDEKWLCVERLEGLIRAGVDLSL